MSDLLGLSNHKCPNHSGPYPNYLAHIHTGLVSVPFPELRLLFSNAHSLHIVAHTPLWNFFLCYTLKLQLPELILISRCLLLRQ